ncbi:MAG: histidine triad nucleotide-binding protein [Clostridiales bacterium]|jgi:histidine triad (HIT) family protein|nr:histidine triad nucleotide-binding protein [Eubacteriales bacterium]MDH7565518.1 histidine triad nucleotide-binding protein [Clostridiales bacterium]
MEDCIFCKIIDGKIPATVVYEDDRVIAFRDIQPVAPVHVLIVPKQHIQSIREINENNGSCLIDIHMAANKVAEKLGIWDKGYRLINNCGADAGQTVLHLHYHLIGGMAMGPKII